MPIKTFHPETGRYLVEFRIPTERGADAAWLAGEFNDWSTDSCPLEKNADSSLSIVIPLAPGRAYRYRYYLGGDVWENDWAADDYVDNELGGTDSLVSVPLAPSRDDAVPWSPGDGPGPRKASQAAAQQHVGGPHVAGDRSTT